MHRLTVVAALLLAAAACDRPANPPPGTDSLPPPGRDSLPPQDTVTSSTDSLTTTPLGARPWPRPAGRLALDVQGTAACPPITGDCRVILKWTRPTNYIAAQDTAWIRWTRAVPAPDSTLRNKRNATATADTLPVKRPAAGTSVSGPVTLCYRRAGWTGSACNTPLTFTVTAPAVPPVDTAGNLELTKLTILPDSVKFFAAGQQQQFCIFLTFADGKVAQRTQDRPLKDCLTYYESYFTPTTRAVTAAQQSKANATCVNWSATGGTIGAEVCNTPASGPRDALQAPAEPIGWDYYLDHQMPAAVGDAILAAARGD